MVSIRASGLLELASGGDSRRRGARLENPVAQKRIPGGTLAVAGAAHEHQSGRHLLLRRHLLRRLPLPVRLLLNQFKLFKIRPSHGVVRRFPPRNRLISHSITRPSLYPRLKNLNSAAKAPLWKQENIKQHHCIKREPNSRNSGLNLPKARIKLGNRS